MKQEMKTETKKTVRLNLIGINGNAVAIMGAFSSQARREGWTLTEIAAVLIEAKRGDYDHLLSTIVDHCDMAESEEEEN